MLLLCCSMWFLFSFPVLPLVPPLPKCAPTESPYPSRSFSPLPYAKHCLQQLLRKWVVRAVAATVALRTVRPQISSAMTDKVS